MSGKQKERKKETRAREREKEKAYTRSNAYTRISYER